MARKEVEVLLRFRRKFVLIILRPPVQITDASENECWPYCCSGRRVACNFYYSGVCVLLVEWDADEGWWGKKLKDANPHSSKTHAVDDG